VNKLTKAAGEEVHEEQATQKHVETKKKRKKRASKAKKLGKAKTKAAKNAEEKTKSTAISSKVDAAVQTSEVNTSPDSGSTQTIPNADVASHPTLPLPSTMVPKLKATPAAPEHDDDDDSDISSVVSEVSSGTVEQEIESMKIKMAAKTRLSN
jgi:hypothetical protein